MRNMAFPCHPIKTVPTSTQPVINSLPIAKAMMIFSPNLLLSPYHSILATLASLLFPAHAKHTTTV